MASVALEHLDKRFHNGRHAVRDLSLEVRDGEFIVIVGPSGCGKTTTLRLVAGLEEPTSGKVYIEGRLVNHVPPGKRDIAMVFQNQALYPHMSVAQNLAFGLRMRRAPREDIEKEVRAAAQILSLESLLARRPAELSGGERQRVALGRAIVREPKVFLFDEPLSNLDATLRVQMRAEIAQLHRRLEATIIYVTHDQVEAMTLGERIVLLDQGVIQQVDAPLDIYRKPANRFVASFIGSPPMNFFPGVVEGGRFRFDELRNAIVGGVSDRRSAVADADAAAHPLRPSSSAGPPTIRLNETVADGPAVLGVRPEDLLPSRDGIAMGDVTVDVVEHMGHETIAHFTLAGNPHTIRLPANVPAEPGDRLPLAIRPGAFHPFSTDDGRRLD
jgi:multiple sugar transport system ATP-binding protein